MEDLKVYLKEKILGFISIIFILLNLSYILVKHIKKVNKSIKIDMKKVLKVHCFTGIAAAIIAIVHIGNNVLNPEFSFGYISFVIMLLIIITGIIVKYYREVLFINKIYWRLIHIMLTIFFIITLFLHVLTNLMY